MTVRSLPYIIYRSYPDFGYLTDNRNYGYDTSSHSCMKVGDLLLSKVASLFYSVLSCTPQDIDTIVDKLCQLFSGELRSTLREDAIHFYSDLSIKGFVCFDNNISNSRLSYFSYENRKFFDLSLSSQQLEESTYLETIGRTCQLQRVHIDVSGKCNENCIHCYIPNNKKCGVMSLDLFEQIL